MDSLSERFARYAATRLEGADEVRVENFARIHGGASRETYRVRLHWTVDGVESERGLILRRDPPGSLIETEREIEFAAYSAFHGTAVPVPEALWLEQDPSWLDYPFFVMEEVAGFETSPQAISQPPYAEHAESYAQQMWTILGEIAKADPHALGLVGVMDPPPLDRCWSRELEYWEGVIDEDELFPQPVIRAAIRWLRRNPPPAPTRISVVHGDYRTGNYLYDGEGNIHAILDWEMAHLGDPLEDLAWSINRVWGFGTGLAGGLVEKERAIRIWEAASNSTADRDALRWWELFTSVKGQGIWVSSNHEFLDGKNRDPILAVAGWFMVNTQDRAALETMGYLK